MNHLASARCEVHHIDCEAYDLCHHALVHDLRSDTGHVDMMYLPLCGEYTDALLALILWWRLDARRSPFWTPSIAFAASPADAFSYVTPNEVPLRLGYSIRRACNTASFGSRNESDGCAFTDTMLFTDSGAWCFAGAFVRAHSGATIGYRFKGLAATQVRRMKRG